MPGHTSGITTYTVTCDVKAVELFELLFFNIEEKVTQVEVGCTNSELPIQVKQLKNRPGVAEDKLLPSGSVLRETLKTRNSVVATSSLIFTSPFPRELKAKGKITEAQG